MLKIKDGVDLKELEKFGFERSETWARGDSWERDSNFFNPHHSRLEKVHIGGDWAIKHITWEFPYTDIPYRPDISTQIQDLITANLVEKVGDK